MDYVVIAGAALALTWLTETPKTPVNQRGGGGKGLPSEAQVDAGDYEHPDEDEVQTIRDMVSQVIVNPDTGQRLTNEPDPKDYPDAEVVSTKGETPNDEEEIEGKGYVNPKAEYKAISTDLVNRHFLAQLPDVFRFLKLVIDTHVSALELYADRKGIDRKQIRFVYKGGNVLRIVASQFLVELPGHAAELIDDFYMSFFKRSDADFSIYVDPKLRKFDEIHAELTQLTYVLQQHIRERMVAQPHNYFEYFRLNHDAQQSIMSDYLNALNKSQSLEDPTNARFYGGQFDGVEFEGVHAGAKVSAWESTRDVDTFITVDEATGDSVTFTPSPNKRHYLRIQYNTALEFGKDKELASFNLVRTKVIFATLFKDEIGQEEFVRFGGELIDVSLPKRKDSGLSHFFDTPNAVDKYELKHAGESLQFLGYSLQFLMDDLDLILFIRSAKPWNDNKYEKRLNRLFYLSFVELFVQFNSNTERKRYLKDFCARIVTKAYKSDLSERAKRFLESWKSKAPGLRGFTRLAKRITGIAVSKDDAEFADYREFVGSLQRNCIVTLTAFKNIGRFCSKGSTLAEQRIYQGKFNSLVRGE